MSLRLLQKLSNTKTSTDHQPLISDPHPARGALRKLLDKLTDLQSRLARLNSPLESAEQADRAEAQAKAEVARLEQIEKDALDAWILGPIAAAAAFVAVEAFGSGISAAGGADIGPNVNPLAQLHENEVVLPAPLAQGFRNIIANQQSAGGAGGAQGQGGPQVINNNNFNVSAIDAKSFAAYINQPGVMNQLATNLSKYQLNNPGTRAGGGMST